jgi:hypothetical protein
MRRLLAAPRKATDDPIMANPHPLRSPKTVVFVGLMEVGKTCIGGAWRTPNCPFIDADKEIEEAARCDPRFAERYGGSSSAS